VWVFVSHVTVEIELKRKVLQEIIIEPLSAILAYHTLKSKFKQCRRSHIEKLESEAKE
jgi:mRNA-degrading endonuclease YafQ of YafQ-DinJ toxin-antitoxin module